MPSRARRANAHGNVEQYHPFCCIAQPSRLQCSAPAASFPVAFLKLCLDKLGPHPARFWGGAGGLSPLWHPLLWPQGAPAHPNLP